MYSLIKKLSGIAEAITGAAPVLLSAVLLALTSCSSSPKLQKASTVAFREGMPGGTLVETYKITVTVTEIDPASRKVTLVAPDGSRNSFTAGPGDRSFSQLRAGEQAQATVTRQLVVFLRKDGAALSEGPVIAAALAPPGAESGVLKSDTVQRTAKVGSVDQENRQVTLEFPDGTAKTFVVRKEVELQGVKAGEVVVIRTTSAVVLTLEKP
jgi:hypothetical protein